MGLLSWDEVGSSYAPGSGRPQNFTEANGTAPPRTAVAIPLYARKRWRLHVKNRSSKSLRCNVFGREEPRGAFGTVAATDPGELPTAYCLLLTLSVRPNGDLVFAEIRLEQYFFRAQISRLKELSG